MREFFNIPMINIAVTLAALLIICLLVLLFLGFRNRILVKLALRNIPRRPAQTALIVIGLMLSTTIISASLAIGDTVSGTIRGAVLDALGDTDLRVRSPLLGDAMGDPEQEGSGVFGNSYLDESQQQLVLDTTAGDDRIDGVLPQIRETLPVLDERTQLTEARMVVAGFDPSRTAGFGTITSTGGEEITIASLAPTEVLINEPGAEQIDARAGDTLTIVTPSGRQEFTVRAVVRKGGLAANDRRVLMRLDTMQQVMGREGQVNRIDISLRGGLESGLPLSDEVTRDLRVAFTDPEAAQNIFEALDNPDAIAAIETRIAENPGGSITTAVKADLESLVAELRNSDTVTDEFRSLIVDSQVAGQVAAALDAAGLAATLLPIALDLARVEVLGVDEIKEQGLNIAELVGSVFVTFFTIFGSFSIIVGLLLIFLVFVMLAAARSNEMGIARAVGTKRRHLVEMFTFEGAAYAVGAAVVGTVIGLVASGVLVQLLIRAIGDIGQDFEFRYTVTVWSVIAGFSLGLLLTLATVGVSAYRVSKLNIVVAIRGLPSQFEKSDTPPLPQRLLYVLQALAGPFYYAYRFVRLARRGDDTTRPMLLFLLMLLILPWLVKILWSIYKVFSPYLGQGWPLIILGGAIALGGIGAEQAAPWTLGMSILFVGVGLLVRFLLYRSPRVRREVADRWGFTLMGVLILVFWALPFNALEPVTGELSGGIEMFILSGVWMVASAVWIVMYNADIITNALQATLGRIGGLRPILKPAIAYPTAARFRTGLTVAMFALVIFTVMVFSIINNLGSDIIKTPDRATGGFDIRAETSPDLPVTDIQGGIAAAPNLDINDFQVIAREADFDAEARQVGAEELRFLDLGVRGTDETYLREVRFTFSHYDPSFLPPGVDQGDEAAVARAIWDRLADDPSLAVISNSRLAVPAGAGGFGFPPAGFQVEGITTDDPAQIEAFDVVVRQPRGSGEEATRRVIAVVDLFAGSYEATGFEGAFSGIYTSADIFPEVTDDPVPFTTFRIRLIPGADASRIAAAMETAFLDNGMLATDTVQEIRDSIAQNDAFGRLFQAFMGLGLVVGVASLGVLSFRAVVERRHSIGMMRAIGYRSRMIQVQFLLESVFVTVIGSALGVGLGALISFNIINDIGDSVEGLHFAVPWATVTVILLIALVAALITTYFPARQASRIYPSEALRYE